MDWPSTAASADAVIIREKTAEGLQFVVYGKHGPQFMCGTYVAAEARALSYAEQASACVWYADARGLQLVGSFMRPPSGSAPPRPSRRSPLRSS
ncbi:MAG: hypothetical protein A3I61_10460 [Acidobacteria bacterium RIFCSPLOWO2_02_FULL_68_18]|nr:MAG: hypothetical protein A3I61_10460 [Acidobacteria bacterium RIFCSPLOWO2_02_FULL_68_18]OFW48670.1 MAG: hypothetical protein A3G77_14295 [Acidobacteria bacterium RIFCSPLOWO2_12_FULL_68_19]